METYSAPKDFRWAPWRVVFDGVEVYLMFLGKFRGLFDLPLIVPGRITHAGVNSGAPLWLVLVQ